MKAFEGGKRFQGEALSGLSSLIIKDLNVGFDGKSIISGLCLDVKVGENLIIAGPNGCGKTTLLKCITGLIKPFSGSIEISEHRRGFIAYCGQEKSFSDFPISVLEVLCLGIPSSCRGGAMEKRISSALRRTNCTHLAGRNFFSLSGGEKQRVSIARCLCQDPGLLLLDEPSTYLDSKGRDELFSILDGLASTDITILMVTHESEIFSHFSTWRTFFLGDLDTAGTEGEKL